MRIPPAAISEPTRASVNRRRPRSCAGAFVLLVLAVSAGGCAKARAEANPAGPPLSMPAPPPRALMPVEAEPIAATPTAGTPVASVPRVAPTPLPPRRPATVRTEPDARVEQPPAASVSPAAGAAEPRELRTVPSSPTAPAAEARIQKYLSQADQDRRRVEYAKLSTEARRNYDESKRLSEQAVEKLKERNVPFALSAAEKAATLAAALGN